MSDLVIIPFPDTQRYDALLALGASDLATDEGLQTAVLVSLLTDAEDDAPEPGQARRGWWGDALAAVDGDRIGSRLYRLKRRTRVPGVLVDAKAILEAALAWLIEDGIAASATATCAFGGTDSSPTLQAEIAIQRSGGVQLIRFADLWTATLDSTFAADTQAVNASLLATGDYLSDIVNNRLPRDRNG